MNVLHLKTPVITLFIVTISFLLINTSCFFMGSSKNSRNNAMIYYQDGNFIYEDNLLILSGKIAQAEMTEGYIINLIIINNNIDPITMDYYNDILTMNHEDRIYSLGKVTPSRLYPSGLEPGESMEVTFQIDGVFNDTVYEIKELIFKIGERRYILRRNPTAHWAD
jgi:hypothetical protein